MYKVLYNDVFQFETDDVDEILNQIDPEDFSDTYDEFLDCNEDVTIGSLKYPCSLALREIDPVAYRCGLLDFIDLERSEIKYMDIGDEYCFGCYKIECVEE